MREITESQQALLDLIGRRIATDGYPPTMREMCDGLGLVSTNGVSDTLKALERKGFIERKPRAPRAIKILKRRGSDER